jgi:HNH endonuclease
MHSRLPKGSRVTFWGYKGMRRNGRLSRHCDCRQHIFADPWHKELEEWRLGENSNIKSLLLEKGLRSPTPPAPLPHVILASPEDQHLVEQKRWRVMPSPRGKRARFEVRRSARGVTLQRLVLPDAKVIIHKNCDGTDCRRENLQASTMNEVAMARETRRRKRQMTAREMRELCANCT